jgi:ribonuclease HII
VTKHTDSANEHEALVFFQQQIATGRRVVGLDEVGRGPLLGPVVAAAVILDPARPIQGLTDSKKLSEKRRNALDTEIRENAFAWALGRAEVEEIDALNILQASLLAMQRAYLALKIDADVAMVDGNAKPALACQIRTVIKGDLIIPAISAASILAKVARDAEMRKLDQQYPAYAIAQHKGYPTQLHRDLLERHGPLPIHRRSFGPVKKLLGE